MKVLLTGGTGYIGSAMLPALLKHGHEVLAVARRAPEGLANGVHWVHGDLAAPLPELPPVDAIIHLAQATVPLPQSAEEMYAVNAHSTLRLLEHARRCGAKRFMLASTGNVYGFGSRPFTEDDPLRPQGFYAVTKTNAENLVRGYRSYLDTSLLRFFTPYGAGQTARLIPDLISRVREGRPVILKEGGRPRLTPIYIDDVVEVCCRLLDHDGHLTVNIAGDQHVSLREIAQMAGELCGRDPVFQAVDEPAPGDLTAENARIKELTGMTRLLSVREGLARMI
jgi:UDP-glucose 4-epimerase